MKYFNLDSRDYHFRDTFVAGLVLTGSDTKSLRTQTPQFVNSKIDIINGIPYILNLHIPIYRFSQKQIIDVTADRKLLLKQGEIAKLISYRHQKYAMVPISIFTKGSFFKLEIGVGHKIKKYEKREKLRAEEFKKSH